MGGRGARPDRAQLRFRVRSVAQPLSRRGPPARDPPCGHRRPFATRRPSATHSRRLRAQAESQIRLLTEAEGVYEGDFYSYRYFATEGFLPGYNFPRLPISAYVPGRRRRRGRDEFISRPRFLAISEFGPAR